MSYQDVEYPDGKGYKRHGSPEFYTLLEEMASTHDRKSHDYAKNNAPFGNYEFAGTVAAMFSHSPLDAGFAGRLAEKIFRLSVLESSGLQPQNESVADTDRDIAVIATLWMAARRVRAKKKAEKLWKEEQSKGYQNHIDKLAEEIAQDANTFGGEVELSVSQSAAEKMKRLEARLTDKELQTVVNHLSGCLLQRARLNLKSVVTNRPGKGSSV